MLFQPSNIYPSTLSGIGAGTVDVTQGLNVSWQVNGDTPMTAYQIKIYQNDTASTLKYDSGSVSVSPAFETHDKYGNPTFYSVLLSAATLSTAGIVNGYQYGYKMLISQWWGVSDYVEQTSASVFITRSLPTISIDAIPNPVTSSSITITATYAQAQGDPISTVDWVFALAGSESNPIKKTGAVNTQVLSFDADGLITGNTYSIMCNVVTANGMEASTGFVPFTVSYSSSIINAQYTLAQLKNSSAVYLSWEGLGTNILSYPYTDGTKTTNGITFTVNGEGDVTANGTASADAYFTIEQGTPQQINLTSGQKLIISSGYSGAKIEVDEINVSNVVVSKISGKNPLQYVVPTTTNTLKISIVIPSGTVLNSQTLQPIMAAENRIVSVNDLTVSIKPEQNLNGYSSPWPGGAGANLFGANDATNISSGSNKHLSVSGELMTVSASGTVSSSSIVTSAALSSVIRDASIPDGTYYFNVWDFETDVSGATVSNIRLNVSDNGTTVAVAPGSSFTVTNGGAYLSVASSSSLNWSNGKHISFRFSITTENVAAWTPYENICPITGLTGLNVYRTGFNLCQDSVHTNHFWESGVLKTNKNANYAAIDIKIPVVPGEDYCIYVPDNTSGGRVYVSFFDASESFIEQENDTIGSTNVFTTTADARFIAISFYKSGGVLVGERICVSLSGPNDGTYEPYQGTTYTVDWTTQAGTVYGGSMNMTSGSITSNMGFVVLDGTETWQDYILGNGYAVLIPDMMIDNNGEGYTNWLPTTNNINTIGCNFGKGNNYLYVNRVNGIGGISDLASWKAYLGTHNLQVVYTKNTSATYQIDSQNTPIYPTTIIWSDSGPVEVSYTTNAGSTVIVSGETVSIDNSEAVNIPSPTYTPAISSVSIYRYTKGESALRKIASFSDGTYRILDYYAPSQSTVSYLIQATTFSGSIFVQTSQITPVYWFYSVLLCEMDSEGNYHVSKEYIFKYGVETGGVSNNNNPTLQSNFTPYPNRQPISSLYKTGKLSSYIGSVNKYNQYSDTVSLQNAIFDISTSTLTKFIKSRKGDVIMADTASAIQMETMDNTTQQALKATLDWVEIGDSSQSSIVSVPTDSFWPIK